MNLQERIDALQNALDTLDRGISTVSAALDAATKLTDIESLNSQLVDMNAERQRLQFQLDNLRMAANLVGDIAPEAAAKVRALTGELGNLVVRGATVSATLDFATAVLGKVSELRKAAG